MWGLIFMLRFKILHCSLPALLSQTGIDVADIPLKVEYVIQYVFYSKPYDGGNHYHVVNRSALTDAVKSWYTSVQPLDEALLYNI